MTIGQSLGFTPRDRARLSESGRGKTAVASNVRPMVGDGATLVQAAPTAALHVRPETLSILQSVPRWWRARAERAGLSGPWLDVEYALEAAPPFGVQDVNGADLDHLSAHALGQAYVESLTAIDRSENGRHYTPDDLAARLWQQARTAMGWNREARQLPGLVRDPASGGGALLLPVVREHIEASAGTEPSMVLHGLPGVIEGIDLDPCSVWITNVVLAAEVLSLLARIPEARRRPIPALARVGDGLDPELRPALICVMNPPYGRLKLSDRDRMRFHHVLYGHANIYGLFMAEGARNLVKDGVVAALVPTSFSAGLYFHRLRGYLSDEAPLSSITFVQNRSGVFSGVLQETCLAVFSRQRHRKTEVWRANGHVTQVATVTRPRGDRPWLLPREASDAAVAVAASALPLTLSQAGWHASTGPLVWNRRKADLFSRPGKDRSMILWAADIDGGTVHRDRGRDPMRYLKLTSDHDEKVMLLSEPAVLVQRTTAPEQLRRLVAADLSAETLEALGGQVVVENHVNVLRPNALLPLVSRETLAHVLATPTMDRVLRCLSGSVAVSSYELAALPLPDGETLAAWEELRGPELEKAVAAAYRIRRSN